VWFRLTLGLRKLGGEWKIAHHHESVPFYMDGSYRAAVDLVPQRPTAGRGRRLASRGRWVRNEPA
jgi:PhnB protein